MGLREMGLSGKSDELPAGYAVVNMNLPGYANREDPPSAFSEHQGKCYYEVIE
jgi:hypothetical protein